MNCLELDIDSWHVLVDVHIEDWFRVATVYKSKTLGSNEWSAALLRWSSSGNISPQNATTFAQALTRCAQLAAWLDERLQAPGDTVTEDEVRAAWETAGNMLSDPGGF